MFVPISFLLVKQCSFSKAKYYPGDAVATINLPRVRLYSDNSLYLKSKAERQKNRWKCQYFPRLWYVLVNLSFLYPMKWKNPNLFSLQDIPTVRATTEKGKLEWPRYSITVIVLVTEYQHAINKYFMKKWLINT